jgi:hypothetical protein
VSDSPHLGIHKFEGDGVHYEPLRGCPACAGDFKDDPVDAIERWDPHLIMTRAADAMANSWADAAAEVWETGRQVGLEQGRREAWARVDGVIADLKREYGVS